MTTQDAKQGVDRTCHTPLSALGKQVTITRPAFTQVDFDTCHLKNEGKEKTPLKDKIKSNLFCSRRRLWKVLSGYVPVIKFIRYYKPRENGMADFLSGLTVGILHIPQALAFGQLTSVKVQNGLLTSLWPVLIYVFFGTSAHVSIGTSAVICMLTAATVDREAQAWVADKPWITDKVTNGTILDEVPEYLDFKEELAMGIALITGVMMLVMGFLKLGFITAYLSESFFTAFTSAAAVHIGTSQLPAMLGINTDRYSGIFKIIKSYQAIFQEISNINVAAVLCAVVTVVMIWIVKDCINERFKHKMFAPVPIELIVVIVGTVVSHFGQFNDEFSVQVVGKIPTNIPPPVIPKEGLKGSAAYLADCFILAVLIFANTIAMAKICAKKHNYEVDDSQEMLAYGMCNAVSAFFRCFPSSVAPPRSMAASSMNAKTTLNGIVSCVLMLMLILFVSPVFTDLPKAILSAIIFSALKGLFMQVAVCRKFWRINRFDFVIWLVTFLATVFLEIDVGLGVGVGISLITVVFQTQFSRGYKVGYTLKDKVLVEHSKYSDSSELHGIKVFKFQSSLYFANAEIFRNTLYRCSVNPRKLLKGLQKKEKQLAVLNKERVAQGLVPLHVTNCIQREDAVSQSDELNSSFTIGSETISEKHFEIELGVGQDSEPNSPGDKEGRNVFSPGLDNVVSTAKENKDMPQDKTTAMAEILRHSLNKTSRRNTGSLKHAGSSFSVNFDDYTEDPDDGDELFTDDKLNAMLQIHHVIIDCHPINYLDSTGANVLSHIYTEYSHVNIQLLLAGCSYDMRKAMEHAGVFEKIPRDSLFIDLHDAIAFSRSQHSLPLTSEVLDDYSDDEANEDSYITRL